MTGGGLKKLRFSAFHSREVNISDLALQGCWQFLEVFTNLSQPGTEKSGSFSVALTPQLISQKSSQTDGTLRGFFFL